ncbi:MAG: MBOAT family protein [Vicinamibacterales bacterium]
MSFVSWSFVVLFLVVLAGRLTIGRRKTEPAFVALLVAASVVFYAWHIPQYIVILVGSAAVDYVAGLQLGRLPLTATHRRRGWLVASLVTNLGLLGFFKYGDFVLRAVGDLMGLAGSPVAPPELGLILPMGISFYTFQSLSYTIDVYRGVLAPIDSFPRFFLYISFFPQLVAGPIVRAAEFLPQLPRPRRLRLVVFYEGSWLIIRGFFLKMVCADNLAVYVDEHWARGYLPETNAAFALWLALMFSGQIFADFAGYSSIARGLAYLLGFRLPVNFNAPYVAGSLKNFWERWHITLSTWLRDYLYVPLGGNRISRRRTYANLLAVMLLGGLWHGAAYTFIVWGAIHGGALAVERALGLHRQAPGRPVLRLVWFGVAQAVVLVAWVFFRSDSLGGALRFVGNLAALDPGPLPGWALVGSLFLLPLVALHAWTWAEERGSVRPLAPAARGALAAAMAYAAMTFYAGTSEFIYFQF